MTAPRHPSLALDAETLLSHSAWLARFARALVANEADIDDVVQQTLVTALEKPPRHAGNLRGWLGTVARNVVRTRSRSDEARVAREVAVPPPPTVESPAEAVERAELRRMVVESVLALDEPYRSTVILRFFEEQEVAVIARLTAAGEDTVRTRIRRGVLRVREVLERKVDDRAHGAADEGVAARALLFVRLREIAANGGGSAGGGTSLATGATAHGAARAGARLARVATTRQLLVCATAVLVGAVGWWWGTHSGTRQTETVIARHEPLATDPASDEAPAPAIVAERSREAIAPTPPTPTFPPPRPVKRATIRGTVTGPDGNPVAGARVWAVISPSHEAGFTMPDFGIAAHVVAARDPGLHREGDWIGTISDREGRYEISGLSTVPGWSVGAYEPTVGATITDCYDFDHDHLEVVADVQLMRGTVLRGSVRDEGGVPVGSARVFLFTTRGTETARTTFTANASGPSVGEFEVGFRCGDSFEIGCGTPGFFGTKRGRVTIAPHTKETNFKITLKRKPGSVVRGRIVDRTGLPLKLEPLLDARFASTTSNARPLKASVWAIAPGAKLPPMLLAGVATGDGVIEGRIDFVEGMYEVVVATDFRGSLELRLFKTVVGTVPLLDPARPPDLPCDEECLPKLIPLPKFTVRYVDAGSKEPIDLEREELLPQEADSSPVAPIVDSIGDPRHGVVTYRCAPGLVKFQPLIRGHALSLFLVDVPEAAPEVPMTLEVPRTDSGVHGFAFHADGRPFAKAPISIFRRSSAGMIDTTGLPTVTNGDGEFEFAPLAKGEHVVVLSGQSDEAPGVTRFVASDPFPEIEVRTAVGHATRFHVVTRPIVGGATGLRFRIVDADGLVLEDLARNRALRSTSADEFSARLRDGHYAVLVDCDGDRHASLEFDVPASDTIDVSLEPFEPRAK